MNVYIKLTVNYISGVLGLFLPFFNVRWTHVHHIHFYCFYFLSPLYRNLTAVLMVFINVDSDHFWRFNISNFNIIFRGGGGGGGGCCGDQKNEYMMKLLIFLGVIKNWSIFGRHFSRGGGGGTLIFSAYVGSGPASTNYPLKISGISSTPKIFEILATPQKNPILYLVLKKRP